MVVDHASLHTEYNIDFILGEVHLLVQLNKMT
jgi:hypothetical protein